MAIRIKAQSFYPIGSGRRQSRFVVTGTKAMEKKFLKMAEEASRKILNTVARIGYDVMERSREEFVPVDEGDLKRSGHVSKRYYWGRLATVELSYGGQGETGAYALAVHEHLSRYSPPSWRNTTVTFHPNDGTHGPKFLERPLMEEAAKFDKDAADYLGIQLVSEKPASGAISSAKLSADLNRLRGRGDTNPNVNIKSVFKR